MENVWSVVSWAVLGAAMVGAGVMHFVRPRVYERMIPPSFPSPKRLTRPWAAWGLILLFVAVFPANVYMALHPEKWRGLPQPLLWARLPLQAALIYWAFRLT